MLASLYRLRQKYDKLNIGGKGLNCSLAYQWIAKEEKFRQ